MQKSPGEPGKPLSPEDRERAERVKRSLKQKIDRLKRGMTAKERWLLAMRYRRGSP